VPTLRHKLAALIGAVAMFSAVFLLGGAAQAQSYPPGTSVPSCTVGNVNAGSISVGQTVTFTLCGNFAPGAAVTVTVNGVSVFTKAPTNGAVTVVITVKSSTVLAVDDPVNVAAVCGVNTAVATGATVGGGSASSSGTFNLVCTSSTTTSSGLAFTGTNVIEALLVAFALIVIGALLVVFQRRRRQTI
jgi:hypothetical protein